MKSVLSSIIIIILVLAVAGVAYYFLFMSGPEVDTSAPVRSESIIPKIDVGAMQNPVFDALRNYSVLPITVDLVGNTQPFSEIITAPVAEEEAPVSEGETATVVF